MIIILEFYYKNSHQMKIENKNPYFTRSPTHLGFECIVQKSQALGRQNPRVWNLEQSFSTSYKLKTNILS